MKNRNVVLDYEENGENNMHDLISYHDMASTGRTLVNLVAKAVELFRAGKGLSNRQKIEIEEVINQYRYALRIRGHEKLTIQSLDSMHTLVNKVNREAMTDFEKTIALKMLQKHADFLETNLEKYERR